MSIRSRLPTEAPYLLVMAIVAIGMVRTLTQHWREGAVLLGAALLVAAVLRLVLPTERVGLLAIRSKPIDVLSYGGLGAVISALAMTITASLLGGG